jgi:hypothetical protein
LAADERQQIADTFGIKTDAVLTPAEYEDQFNRSPDTRQPLPELTVAEQAVAMRQANQLLSRLEKTVAERVEAFKAEGAAAGKRGKYVTANRLASIRAEATQLLIDELQPDDWTDEMWDEWFAYHSGEFDAAGMPDDEFSDLLVAATVAARAAKAKPRSG